MQPIPGCRIRVWKKEWQQTVGSQTSLTTGTRRIVNRDEQRSREREKRNMRRGRKEERRRKGWRGEMSKGRRGKGLREVGKGGVGGREANG